MAKLDFEKPLAELEERIESLRKKLGEEDNERALTESVEIQLDALQNQAEILRRDICDDLGVWERVQLSRHPERPYFKDYLELIFEDFVELHGDRAFSDDPAIIAGFALLNKPGGSAQRVCVIGHQKGRSTKEKVRRNFGMAHPEGYRKACRIMKLAERFGMPILTFIDTPGAYPGIGAEERGQSEAIGAAIALMSTLKVPIIATVIGEGGSGGALALGVANKVFMLEHATYSVITPEGCASILWRDGALAPKAAEQLKLLGPQAKELGITDDLIAEPIGGAHREVEATAAAIKHAIEGALHDMKKLSPEAVREHRYQRFRVIGKYDE